jgi:hypothetical protein
MKQKCALTAPTGVSIISEGSSGMLWDIFALQRVCYYKNHEIRVQKTSYIHRMQYGLAIDGVKQDQVDALAGTFSLHGVIRDGETETPVEIIIKQRLFSGTYFCRVGGITNRMERYRVEGC